MRKTLYCLFALVLIASTAKGVSASTDCQRWLADYKKTLAEKTATQHLLAARNRARAAARRKLAHLTAPTVHPAPVRISSVRPHLSPAQMLKRFDLLCGDLPVGEQVLDSRMSPDEFISEVSMGGPLDLESSLIDGTLIAESAPPAPFAGGMPESPGNNSPTIPVYGPIYGPSYGSPLVPPSTPGSPSGPSHSGVPTSPGIPVPPIAPVPEPSSILLMITGVFGALTVINRRSLS